MAIFLLPFVAVMWGLSATGPARRAPRSGRRLLRFALGVAGTSVGVILLYAFENWHAERAWQRYKHSLMAQGQRFDPALFVLPPVPDAQNFLKAPGVKDWFVPPRYPSGVGPTACGIGIARSGDERLLGSWSECRPTDLTEWRQYFRRVRPPDPPATNDPPEPAAADGTVPLIVIDEVPLYAAILNLARQAHLNFQFDLGLIDPTQGGKPLGHTCVSIRFEQVTPREALEALLSNHGLALVKIPHSGLFRVTKALAPAPAWLDDLLDLETAPLPPVNDQRVPLILIEDVPVLDAVRNVARQALVNFQFDPGINSATVSNAYTLHLTNATLREALTRVLYDNGLALTESERVSIYRVVRPRTIPRSAQARRYYSAAAVLASFESFDEGFRALYAACDRPQSRMNLDTPRPFPFGPSRLNLGSYRQVAQALTLHASAQLALSNAPMALRDATALFRLSESLRHPPDLLAAVLQVSLCDLHLQLVWEGLVGRRWSAGQLETLESQLQTVNLLADCFVGLEAEQASWNQWLEHTPRAELADQFVESRTAWRLRRGAKPLWALPLEWNIRWCPRGWIRQAQIGYTEAFQDHLAVLDVRHQRVFPARDGTSSGLPSRRRPG